jgi:hypothetical protein
VLGSQPRRPSGLMGSTTPTAEREKLVKLSRQPVSTDFRLGY